MSQYNNQHSTQSLNPQLTTNTNSLKSKPNHSQHNHEELDSDCEGCQAQKKQNEKLVDFYQRLDKISTKVKKFKQGKNQKSQIEKNETNHQNLPTREIVTSLHLKEKLKILDEKLNIPELPSVNQIKEFSSKEIGFELAAALIQRQMKYKNQNKKLQEKINELLAEKKKKEQLQSDTRNSSFFNALKADPIISVQSHNPIKDSLDDLNKNPKTVRKQKDGASFWDIENTSTNGFKSQETTFFETKNKKNIMSIDKTNFSQRNHFEHQSHQTNIATPASQKTKNPYSTQQNYGLNLWLYQFKAQDYEQKMQSSWISDNKRPQFSQRYNKATKNRNDPNKSPRISNINKTSVIQKNLIGQYARLDKSRKKNY